MISIHIMRNIVFSMVLIFICHKVVCFHNPKDRYIDTNHVPTEIATEVMFSNDYTVDLNICWLPADRNVCLFVAPGAVFGLMTTVGHEFGIFTVTPEVAMIGTIAIVGGKHKYSINQYLTNAYLTNKVDISQSKDVVRILRSNACKSGAGAFDYIGPSFSDAIRTATYRNGHPALCFCGSYNMSTTFTLYEPNNELPVILDGSACNCDGPGLPFDFYMPCEWLVGEPKLLKQMVDCEDLIYNHERNQAELRLFMLHSTTIVDMLSMKHKLWEAASLAYGEDASLIMPYSFNVLNSAADIELFADYCRSIVEAGDPTEQYFIAKNVVLHRQHGISIMTASKFLNQLSQGLFKSGTLTITKFLPKPYLVNNAFKLNIRRYVLLVCTGGRLRAYVHDDGKVIYTKKPYREPWEQEEFMNETEQETDVEGNAVTDDQYRLDELITTGYVPEQHYNDKPLSISEFKDYLRSLPRSESCFSDINVKGVCIKLPERVRHSIVRKLSGAVHAIRTLITGESDLPEKDNERSQKYNLLTANESSTTPRAPLSPESLMRSMSLRLALAVHSANTVNEVDLCEVRSTQLRTVGVPMCLQGAVRFQHLGCDFHIDASLTGYESRLFECNKGPDMSVHSYRDGSLKRNVVADILSFVGFKGKFVGSDQRARKYNLHLIYDSETFEPQDALQMLRNLKFSAPLFN